MWSLVDCILVAATLRSFFLWTLVGFVSSTTLTHRGTETFFKYSISHDIWQHSAKLHAQTIDEILYPPGTSLKARIHQTRTHPTYNFLHTYYRYSAQNIKKYSPGLNVLLEGATAASESLEQKYLSIVEGGGYYRIPQNSDPESKFGWITLAKNCDILKATVSKAPYFGCFGLHEWAMLYSGRKSGTIAPLEKHQPWLSLRVSQDVIDHVVETSSLRCTHYDAFRFFHPVAQEMNVHTPLTRTTQKDFDQPGCIHATMDIFKYAYQLYPFVSSDLLIESLRIAVAARKIDIRASPYDASQYEGLETPICVETAEGRATYAAEQEELAKLAVPIRRKLIDVYEAVLGDYTSQVSPLHS